MDWNSKIRYSLILILAICLGVVCNLYLDFCIYTVQNQYQQWQLSQHREQIRTQSVKIFNGQGGGGSGVVIGINPTTNVGRVLTNGHICNDMGQFPSDMANMTKHDQMYPPIYTNARVQFETGHVIFIERILLHVSSWPDLCIVELRSPLPPGVVVPTIATKNVEFDQPVLVSGYPGGWHQVLNDALYAGSFFTKFPGNRFSEPENIICSVLQVHIYAGSSGSGIWNQRGELIGLIWGLPPSTRPAPIGLGVLLSDIRNFMAQLKE